MNNQEIKKDAGKLRWDLLPWDAVGTIVGVLNFGATKYHDRSWEAGMDYSRLYASLQRHITAWFQGEDTDNESGLSHLSHAACCILFLIAYEIRGQGSKFDNRPNVLNKSEESYDDKIIKAAKKRKK